MKKRVVACILAVTMLAVALPAYAAEANKKYIGKIGQANTPLYTVGNPSKKQITKLKKVYARIPKKVTKETSYIILYSAKSFDKYRSKDALAETEKDDNNKAYIAYKSGYGVDLDVVLHESMHTLHFTKFKNDKQITKIYNKYKKTATDRTVYALEDEYEFLAEMFCYYAGTKSDREYVKDECKPIYNWFKKNVGTVKIRKAK